MNRKIVQITAIDASMNSMLNLLNKRIYDEGYELHCICSPGLGTKKIIDNGYIYHPVNIDRKISPLSNMKSIYQMYKIFKKIKPDIVHVHTPIAGVLGRIAAKLAGVKNIIYTAHGFYFHEGMSKKSYNLFFKIEKFIGRNFTDYIFTQSHEDYLLAKENKFLKNSNNYLHISNGVDVRNLFNVKNYNINTKNNIFNTYKIKGNPTVITFVGRLVKEKGILDLLESMRLLNRKNIILFVIGSAPDSERDQSLKNLMEQNHDLQCNVIFTGTVKNVRTI